jgi:hypothetical protein
VKWPRRENGDMQTETRYHKPPFVFQNEVRVEHVEKKRDEERSKRERQNNAGNREKENR